MIPHISPRVEVNCDEARLLSTTSSVNAHGSSGKQTVSLKTFFLQILTLNNTITNESIMLDVSRRSHLTSAWSWLHRPWNGFQMVWNQSNPTSVTGFWFVQTQQTSTAVWKTPVTHPSTPSNTKPHFKTTYCQSTCTFLKGNLWPHTHCMLLLSCCVHATLVKWIKKSFLVKVRWKTSEWTCETNQRKAACARLTDTLFTALCSQRNTSQRKQLVEMSAIQISSKVNQSMSQHTAETRGRPQVLPVRTVRSFSPVKAQSSVEAVFEHTQPVSVTICSTTGPGQELMETYQNIKTSREVSLLFLTETHKRGWDTNVHTNNYTQL